MPIVHIEMCTGEVWRYRFDDLVNSYEFVKKLIDDCPITHHDWIKKNTVVFRFSTGARENMASVHVDEDTLPKIRVEVSPLWLDRIAIVLGGHSMWKECQE